MKKNIEYQTWVKGFFWVEELLFWVILQIVTLNWLADTSLSKC